MKEISLPYVRQTLRKDAVHMPPENVKLITDPDTLRRDLVYNFVCSKSNNQIEEMLELENMFKLLKGHVEDIIYSRVLNPKKQPTPTEIAYFRLLKEILVDMHRLRYGDKKVHVNVGYEDIRRMMFGKNADTPDNRK